MSLSKLYIGYIDLLLFLFYNFDLFKKTHI